MKTIEQLEQEIARLTAERDRLKAAEWPKVGDEYATIGSSGKCLTCYTWYGDDFDLAARDQGNIFRTEEEALQEAECRAIIAEYRRQPGRKAFVFGEANWGSEFDGNRVMIKGYRQRMAGLFQTYFDCEESCEAAIKAVGEDRLRWAATWQASQGVV